MKQPHAHIMFSDRTPDGIERVPSQHFKRYNPRNPEHGGCKKDRGGREPSVLKNELVSRRESWADLQNEFLEANGHAARVDHRSNKDRGGGAQTANNPLTNNEADITIPHPPVVNEWRSRRGGANVPPELDEYVRACAIQRGARKT